MGCSILVNDVGSCKEFVSELSGKMVHRDASPKEIALQIKAIKESGQARRNRSKIREYWKSEFSMEKNYPVFAASLKK